MGDVVHIGRHRKASAKMKKDAQATENAVKFGRTKAEKLADQQATEKSEAHLDGHKRDADD